MSVSQPHWLSFPPSAISAFQKRSISSCVSQPTNKDMPSANVKLGPPLKAMKLRPKSSKVTDITVPPGPGLVLVMRPSKRDV